MELLQFPYCQGISSDFSFIAFNVRLCEVVWTKVSGPNLVIYLNWKHLLDWGVGRCASKNKHQKILCVWKRLENVDEILLAILGLISNNIIGRDLYDHFRRKNVHIDND